jgi:glycosyltransferase involved in cell wall biosynthesis
MDVEPDIRGNSSSCVAGNELRILYLINSVEGGGAALPVPRIAEALGRLGAEFRVFALTRRDGLALSAFEKAGISCTVRAGGRKDHLAAYRWIGEIIRRERPDIVWTSLTRATVLGQRAAQQFGLPVASWQHAAYLKPRSAFILRHQQKMTSLWICDSEEVAEITARRLRVGPDRLLTWPIFAADPGAPVASPWNGHEALRIGSLGRLHRIKGYDVLATAIRELDRRGFKSPVNWEIVIAGEGPHRGQLTRVIQNSSSGERIRLAGHLDEPTKFLAGLHGYVQPSRSEGFCIASHEAMQAGLPVLASAVGGTASSIREGETGWLVPPGDPVRLADGLAQMLSNPQQLAAMGKAARETVFDRFGEGHFNAVAGSIFERLDVLVQARRRGAGETSSHVV